MTTPRRPLWLRLLRLLRGAAFTLIALITIAALALSIISFQGRREWAATKADLLARGEKLSLVELAPIPGPDAENFFGDPMWKELADVVEVPGENGAILKQPRLPEGQRQIDAWNAPVPADLITLIRKLAPTHRFFPPLRPRTVAMGITQAIEKTDDPALQRALSAALLEVYRPDLPFFHHLEGLLDRPTAVFGPDYSNVAALPLAHFDYLLSFAKAYSQMARAHLVLGDPTAAAAEVATLLRLAGTLRAEPLLISNLVRLTLIYLATATIDRGILAHQWSEPDLIAFETALAGIHLAPDFANALRGERGFGNQHLDLRRRGDPTVAASDKQSSEIFPVPAFQRLVAERGMTVVIDGDQAFYNRYLQKLIDAFESPIGISPKDFPIMTWSFPVRIRHPLTTTSIDNIHASIISTTYRRDAITETRIACALERYRLKNATYPEALAKLTPDFMARIPAPALAGQKFQYRRESPATFRLWTAGWDEIDDGGKVSPKRTNYQTGDWVWNESPGPKR